MGDLVGAIIGATVEVVLQNLISLCAEEINLIRDFKKDLVKLKDSFEMIQSFLNDAHKKQVTNEAVKCWLNKLEAVAFDADNVLRKKVEAGNKLKKKVKSFFSTRAMAYKIRDITENLKSINQEATDFGLQKQLVAHVTSVGLGSDRLFERETDSFSSDSIVVGRENYVSRIVEILTCCRPSHDEEAVFSVLPIVGMGGLGKTTLAKLVFHDGKIETHFDKCIWVYVSENFDANDIFKKIVESLIGEQVDLETKDALLRKLQENLKDKRYLLVLDDVWNEETNRWEDFIGTLSSISSIKGNGIIVTTRSENVASIVETTRIPQLSRLGDEDCWLIMKDKAFRKKSVIPLEFETIGKRIAKRCQGLPLAAKVIGGMLRGKSQEWDAFEDTKLLSLGEDGNMLKKILKLSYDNLPSQTLQKCFALCAIFPKGWTINRRMLTNLWMSDGLLQSDQENDIETAGLNYFDVLLQKSLLQAAHKRNGNVEKCSMHDLVHDLGSSILAETGEVRHFYMTSATDISKEKAQNLRSIIFHGKVSDNMFLPFKCLRGLVLIGDDNKELPKIEHLLHLRYLDIFNTGIECLPESVGKLYHLQVLQANNTLNELPATLGKLINLGHLYIDKYKLPNKPKGNKFEEIPMLGHLPHLTSLILQDLPGVGSIGSLSGGVHNSEVGDQSATLFSTLKTLELSGMSSMTELLTIGETQLGCEVVAFPCLEYLGLFSCRKLTIAPSHFQCLKKLVICGLDTSLFLENILVNLNSLIQLDIRKVRGLVRLPDIVFCNNQNLSHFAIHACHDLTHLPPSFGASLRNIKITGCPKLEELPTNLHCLHSLEVFHITKCTKLTSIPYKPRGDEHESAVQGFTSLHDLSIVCCNGLTELPTAMLESCASTLEKAYLGALTSLTNMAMVVSCLQKMPHLTRLFLDFKLTPGLARNNFPVEIGSFRGLRHLVISCGMENWDRVQNQIQNLTALRTLELCCLEIKVVPEWLGKMSALEELALVGCRNLTTLPCKAIMKHITKLRVYKCPLLNLERDDEDSEWHKISHIPHIHVAP